MGMKHPPAEVPQNEADKLAAELAAAFRKWRTLEAQWQQTRTRGAHRLLAA